MKRIYLAGPDVFKPNSDKISKHLKETCKDYGFEGVYLKAFSMGIMIYITSKFIPYLKERFSLLFWINGLRYYNYSITIYK